jgi:hypothetical protein
MIGGTKMISAGSGAAISAHILSEKNNYVHVLHGDMGLVHDYEADARGHRDQYSMISMHMSPNKNMSPDQVQEMIRDISQEFKVNPDAMIVIEHGKNREGICEADTHYHFLMPRRGDDGKAISVHNSFARLEKVARITEFKCGHDLQPSRHDKTILKFLEQERPEVAEAMRAAGINGEGAKPQSDYTEGSWREAQRHGFKKTMMVAAVKDLWSKADTPAAGIAALENAGFTVSEGHKKIVVEWTMIDGSTKLVGSLDRLTNLPDQDLKEIYHEKLYRRERAQDQQRTENSERADRLGENAKGRSVEQCGGATDQRVLGEEAREHSAAVGSDVEHPSSTEGAVRHAAADQTTAESRGRPDSADVDVASGYSDAGGSDSSKGVSSAEGPSAALIRAHIGKSAVTDIKGYKTRTGAVVPPSFKFDVRVYQRELERKENERKQVIDAALAYRMR